MACVSHSTTNADTECVATTFESQRGIDYKIYAYLIDTWAIEGNPWPFNDKKKAEEERDGEEEINFAITAQGLGCDGSVNLGRAYDACGECMGHERCRGCDGVLYSGKTFDLCGICDGLNDTCLSGCDNKPNSNKVYDVCGVCGGSGESYVLLTFS